MKKRIISLLLILALLPAGGAVGAGTAEDPLISSSYLEGTFIPEMYSALKVILSEAVEDALARRSAGGSMVKSELPKGSTLSVSQGQSFILFSGCAEIKILYGAVADVTLGEEAENGPLSVGSRYIVCEGASAELSISSDATVLHSPAAEAELPEDKPLISPFDDVLAGTWWHNDIVRAYDRGLVNGMTPTLFEPQGNLTIAQTIKLAACMHQLYHEGKVTLEVSPQAFWYMSYVDYAMEKGIISTSFPDYDAYASRRQFVEIFAASLPQSEFEAINDIPQGAIGDIPESGGWVDTVYMFYRAGLLIGYYPNGYYNAHDFGPDSSITRAEAAVIMNRMFDPGARISFTIE